MLEHDIGNLEQYKELRALYSPEEWVDRREIIFGKLPAYARLDRFYREEKLYDRLMAYVQNSYGLSMLQEYEDVLQNVYPMQLLEKYEKEVKQMAAGSGGRKQYSQLVYLLRRMQQIEGGKKAVEAIVAEWRVKYRNRPAMMDELRKL